MAKDSEDKLAKMIGRVSLFAELSEKHLKSIVKSGTERSFEPGQTIVKEGERGVGFYLVLDGKVEVRRKNRVLTTLSEGGFFGEMGLIDDQPRSADVVAVTPTKTLCVSEWAFTGLVKGNPEIAMNMMKALVERLRTTSKALVE